MNLRDEEAKSPEVVGSKAASLAQMLSLRVPSSEGFCVTTEAYNHHLTRLQAQGMCISLSDISRRQSILRSDELSTLRNCILTTEIDIELRQEVIEALEELQKHSKNQKPLRTAVRSSATAEDLVGASFAGQYDSYMNLLGEDAILNGIKKCWASFWSERAYFYRTQKGVDHWKTYMAVIVQELIPAEAAGTLFMLNPVTKNGREAILEASWGLGELVVSGRVTPDTYHINIAGELPVITKKIIKKKRRMLIVDSTAKGGTMEVGVPHDKIDCQVLSDQTILELVQQGLFLSQHYGRPCDIEWAWHNNRFRILQARPITALGKSFV